MIIATIQSRNLFSTVFAVLFFLGISQATCAEDKSGPLKSGIEINEPPPIVLPKELRPFPEEPKNKDAPRFKFRGTRGWNWTAQQYLDEVPYLKMAKMNFMMNCYLSMYDFKRHKNEWWKPLPEEKKIGFAKVIEACQKNDITFCFAMHPQTQSPRPLKMGNEDDFRDFFAHFAWAQSLDVKYFSVSMDDVHEEKAGLEHAQFCNKFLKRLREKDVEAQLIFCPTIYANELIKGGPDYLSDLAKELDQSVYVFWTGPHVVSLEITLAQAEEYKKLVQRRLFIWDNYPANDGNSTLHLGPIIRRDPKLCEVVDGYISNSLYPQNEIDRVPLFTMADYAYNPTNYDPDRSIGQAILHLAKKPEQQAVLARLVEVYRGNIFWNDHGTGFNPVRVKYNRLLGKNVKAAKLPSEVYDEVQKYVQSLESLLAEMQKQFPNEYQSAQKTLEKEIDFLKQDFAKRSKK